MKSTISTLFLTLALFCLSFSIMAQDATLKGVITDAETGETIPTVNVSININGEFKGTASDFDGIYELKVPAGNHTVEFSFVGYETHTLTRVFSAGDVITYDVNMGAEQELLDAVVVTGSKFEQSLGEQTVSLAVIKPSLIESNNNTSLEQSIEKVPGVDVVDGQANIRGGSGYSYGAGSRVMLLMDDLPVLTADAGFPNWDFLPIENLEQIEIIKGASSALYGSSAMNGIINIRTAYPKSEPVTKVSAFMGVTEKPDNHVTGIYHYLDDNGDPVRLDDGNRLTNTMLSEPDNMIPESVTSSIVDSVAYNKDWYGNQFPFEAGFSFAHRQKFGQLDLVVGSYMYTQDLHRETDYDRRARFNSNLRYRVAGVPGLSVGLNVNFMQNTSSSFLIWNGDGPDAYRLWEATPVINNIGTKVTVDPFVEYFTENGMKHKVLGRYFKNNNRNDTNQSTNSDFYYGEYQFQQRLEDIDLTITAGVVASLAKSDAELYLGDGQFEATNIAGYVQLDKKFFEKLNISLGGRYERNTIEDETEAKPVLRAGINYQPAEYTFIRASYGQAYRFPTIAEKFVQTNLGNVAVGIAEVPVGIFPNPDLKSETGWSAELGIKQGFQISDWKGFIDLSGFINEYSDMMEFTFGASTSLGPVIRNGILPFGVEPIWPEFVDVINAPDSVAIAGFQSINIGDTRIIGADFSIVGQGKLFGLPTSILAGYTFTKPEFRNFSDTTTRVLNSNCYHNDADGERVFEYANCKNILKYRFPHTIKVDVESQIKKVSLGVSVRYFSFMEAIDEAFNRFLPGIEEFRERNNSGITIVDARAIFNVTDNSRISFIVKNLTNLEYALRPALIDAPRSYTLKYAHEF